MALSAIWAIDMTILERMGGAVCHQLAARSFPWNGGTMPLCARCTGIYMGALFALGFLLWKKRLAGNRPYAKGQLFLTVCGILPMAADGFCSYAGFWESNAFLRVVTGSLMGAALPGLLLLAGNFDPVGNHDSLIYEDTKEQLVPMAGSVLFGIGLWLGLPLAGAGAVLSILGEVCLWAGVLWLLLKTICGGRSLPLYGLSLVLAFGILFTIGGMRI